MADYLPPPPPYEDIVGRNASYGATSTTPTAPPLEATRYEQPTYNPPANPSGPASTSPAPPTAPPTRDQRGRVERYVSYSIPTILYNNTCRRHEDGSPGDSRTRKSCCVSSCLCCCGTVLVATFVLLPLAMIITGILSYNICTSSNTSFSRLLPLYLYVGGGLLAFLVCLRTCASIFTCCRNRRRQQHTPGSYESKVCICLFEVFVVLWVVANLVLLAAASYFMFGDLINGRSYCTKKNTLYYYLTVSYIFAQYLIYMLSCLFCCLSYCCI